MDQRVCKIISLLKETLDRDWSTGSLAACVNLSPSRLHQVFKEETGLPPARYLRLLRMEQARELLETSHLSVKQVMWRVGVTDESHFVRDFKKTYGLTPARYRERFLSDQPKEAAPIEGSSQVCLSCGRFYEPEADPTTNLGGLNPPSPPPVAS